MADQTRQAPAATPLFPGWRWVIVAVAIPVAGLIGGAISGPVDAPLAALIGGLITGAGLGVAEWFAAKDAFGDARALIATSAVAYGAGLVVAAAAVGYNTDLGSLVAMGVISGLFLGVGQGLVLAQQRTQATRVGLGGCDAGSARGGLGCLDCDRHQRR